jgi:RNA polymerase sigma-70 factor (ECF subfamily)
VTPGELYEREHGRIVASLIRIVGDFDLAEDAPQDAFEAALTEWPGVEPSVASRPTRSRGCSSCRRRRWRSGWYVRRGRSKGARIRYEVPDDSELAERLGAVLAVIYLVFNEGYSAASGSELVRGELCDEAIRLDRLLLELLPSEHEVKGLLALMLLHDARRATRTDQRGGLVTLEDHDRSRWDRTKIEEGAALVERALRGRSPGKYAVQAAIAALHPRASSPETTDWKQIAALYGVLVSIYPSAVVRMNHAIAMA